jgi:hypothetical protein
MTDTAILALFPNRHEGELARGFLDRFRVPAALLADDAGGAEAGLTFVNPARLVVRREDEARARRILTDAGYGDRLTPGPEDEGSDPSATWET